MNRFPVNGQNTFREVQKHIAALVGAYVQRTIRIQPVAVAQGSTDAGQKLRGTKWFCDVIIRAQIQSSYFFFFR
jgi:hypothetical protein